MWLDPRDAERLRRSRLFAELDDEAFEQLASHARRVQFEAAQILFEEGDAPDRFYVVLEGRCEVVKQSGSLVEVITSIEAGACVGELPLLRPGPRSATVRVAAGTALAAFSLEDFRRELHEGLAHPYLPLLFELEAHTVDIATSMTDRTLELEAQRQRVSVFIVYLISLLCGFMFVTQWLSSVTAETSGTTVITLPIIVVITLILIRPIRALDLPWSAYGITRANWRESLRDGLLLALPVLLAATALKLALVSHTEVPVFDCVATLSEELGSRAAAIRHFVLFNLAYVFVVVPLQELIARGLLQGLLERFIAAKHETALAILISNLIFGAFHLYLSLAVAMITVVLGLYFGWIYVRTRNLLGAWLAHALIGTWMLTVVRLQAILPQDW